MESRVIEREAAVQARHVEAAANRRTFKEVGRTVSEEHENKKDDSVWWITLEPASLDNSARKAADPRSSSLIPCIDVCM